MIPFEELTTTQKGTVGEDIVKSYLASKGWIIYDTNYKGAHPFDFMYASADKQKIFLADVKTKKRFDFRKKGLHVTGIDTRHFKQYQHLQNEYNNDFVLFFVDELEGSVYCNLISNLELASYEVTDKRSTKTIFNLDDMMEVCKLTSNEIDILNRLSSGNHEY